VSRRTDRHVRVRARTRHSFAVSVCLPLLAALSGSAAQALEPAEPQANPGATCPSAPQSTAPRWPGPCTVRFDSIDASGRLREHLRTYSYSQFGDVATDTVDDDNDGHVDRRTVWEYLRPAVVSARRSFTYGLDGSVHYDGGSTFEYNEDGALARWTQEFSGGEPGRPDRLFTRVYTADTSHPARDSGGPAINEGGTWTVTHVDTEITYEYDANRRLAGKVERSDVVPPDAEPRDVRLSGRGIVRTWRYTYTGDLLFEEEYEQKTIDGDSESIVVSESARYSHCPNDACVHKVTTVAPYYLPTRFESKRFDSGILFNEEIFELDGDDRAYTVGGSSRYVTDQGGNVLWVEHWDLGPNRIHEFHEYGCWNASN